MIDQLLAKIKNKDYKVGIVGLPLMWTFHQQDMPVLAFDIDQMELYSLEKGLCRTAEHSSPKGIPTEDFIRRFLLFS